MPNGGIRFGFRSKNLLNLDSKTKPYVGFRLVDESFKQYSIESFLHWMCIHSLIRCDQGFGLELPSSIHQEPSDTGVIQIQTQDSSVQLQSLTLTNMTLTLMQHLQTVCTLVMVQCPVTVH